jgi:EAL domain-containing protein (putative c-di-GMP-specific phosphodiesterase class I)
LDNLSNLGITLALDNFGAGYSSLLTLQKYPLKVVKIDRSFIQTITEENINPKFLKAIRMFTQVMEFEVVAEGIETELQDVVCRRFGFDRLQGFYYSKPLSADLLEKQWLKK